MRRQPAVLPPRPRVLTDVVSSIRKPLAVCGTRGRDDQHAPRSAGRSSRVRVSRDDINGTLHSAGADAANCLVRSTPQQAGGSCPFPCERLPELFRAALELVSSLLLMRRLRAIAVFALTATNSTTIVSCVSEAKSMLEHVLKPDPDSGLEQFSPIVRPLLRRSPDPWRRMPVAGFRSDDGDDIEGAWPDQQIGVVLGIDEARRTPYWAWLRAFSPHQWLPEELVYR